MAASERVAAVPGTLAVHLEVDPGLGVVAAQAGEAPAVVALDVQGGMDNDVDADVAGGQDHRHRIDEEGHVVGHDVDDGVGRLPALGVDVGVAGAHDGRARRPDVTGAAVSHGGAVEVVGVGVLEVLVGRPLVVAAHELGGGGAHAGRRPLLGDGGHRVDHAVWPATARRRHSQPPPRRCEAFR